MCADPAQQSKLSTTDIIELARGDGHYGSDRSDEVGMNQDRRADTGLDRLPGELVDWLAKPFASFLRIEAAGGAILLVVTIAALVLSNSPWADQFLTFWELPLGIRIGSLEAARWIHVSSATPS